jgi:hypothetical protein
MPPDEEEGDDAPTRPDAPSARALLGFAKCACLGFGVVLALFAVAANAIQAAALAGLACFLGITARIFQAEEHRTGRG